MRLHIELDVSWSAAYDTLLAVEAFAEHSYPARAVNADQQARYNDLAAIVLPLRAALDAALKPAV